MRIFIAPDKFKGSLSAADVADNLAKGSPGSMWTSASLPLADGGDGSVAAALGAGSNRPLGMSQGPPAGVAPQPSPSMAHTAIVEIANTCGLAASPQASRTDDRLHLRLRRGHPAADRPGARAWCSPWAGAPAPTAAPACWPHWDTDSTTTR